MTTNVSFALLDDPVIHGRGEDPVVGSMTHARLLEEVAALGGILRHLGALAAVPVVVDLEDDQDAVVAALAVARIGSVLTTTDHPDATVLVVSQGSAVTSGRPRLVRGDDVQEPDLEWDLMLRAGRTDPAPCAVLDAGAAYSLERSVGEQIELLQGQRPPHAAADLRLLLGV